MALRPFRFWCQKVLPLVYDDSLSYYELLCKVVKQLNDTGEVVNALSEYVYNLDINKAVEDKLDEWAKDGTLDQLLKDFTIPDGSITNEKLASNAVGTSKIQAGAVKTLQLGDGSVTTAKLADKVITADKLSDEVVNKLLGGYVTPEQFGSKGDGSENDSEYIRQALEYAKTNNISNVLMSGKYKVDTPIDFDFELKTVNVICTGTVEANATITFRNNFKSDIIFKLEGGGTGRLDDSMVSFYKTQFCNLDLVAYGCQATAFNVSSGGGSAFSTVKIKGHTNMRLLKHGNESVNSYAFGTYISILEYNSQYPMLFTNCNDITIEHYENHFNDSTHTRNSIEFKKAVKVNVSSMAVGGTCQYLVLVEDSELTISYLFMLGEEYTSPYPNSGMKVRGKSSLMVDKVCGAYLANLISTETYQASYRGVLSVNSGYYEHVDTPFDINWYRARDVYFNVQPLPWTLEGLTYSSNVSLQSIETYLYGHSLHVSMWLNTTARVNANNAIISNVGYRSAMTLNIPAYENDGTPHMFYMNRQSTTINARGGIDSGKTFVLEFEIPMMNY